MTSKFELIDVLDLTSNSVLVHTIPSTRFLLTLSIFFLWY
jgi:hypothetical protein